MRREKCRTTTTRSTNVHPFFLREASGGEGRSPARPLPAGVVFSATAEAGSTTHNVRVNGDIQAAIDAASNGDTIQLAAGQ